MLIRKSRCADKREQFEICLLAFGAIFDSFVTLSTFGYLTSDVKCWLLFSSPDWLIRDP